VVVEAVALTTAVLVIMERKLNTAAVEEAVPSGVVPQTWMEEIQYTAVAQEPEVVKAVTLTDDMVDNGEP